MPNKPRISRTFSESRSRRGPIDLLRIEIKAQGQKPHSITQEYRERNTI